MRHPLILVLAPLFLASGLAAPGCMKKNKEPVKDEVAKVLPDPALPNPGGPHPGGPNPGVIPPGPGQIKKEPVGDFKRAIDINDVRNTLQNVGLAYHTFFNDRNRGPNDVQELAPYYEKNAKITQALDPREGYITFQWKAHLLRMPAGTSETILAYETAAAGNGTRLVLMADRSVKTMDEAEFQKAPKAGQ